MLYFIILGGVSLSVRGYFRISMSGIKLCGVEVSDNISSGENAYQLVSCI